MIEFFCLFLVILVCIIDRIFWSRRTRGLIDISKVAIQLSDLIIRIEKAEYGSNTRKFAATFDYNRLHNGQNGLDVKRERDRSTQTVEND